MTLRRSHNMRLLLFSTAALLAAASFLVPSAAFGVDFVWTTETVQATRFVEADSADVGEVETGKRVELLATKGERVRVRVSGATFGWIDKSKTTETEPAAEPAEDSPTDE